MIKKNIYYLIGLFLFSGMPAFAQVENNDVGPDIEIAQEVVMEFPVIVFVGANGDKMTASKMACFDGELQYVAPETDVKIIVDKEKLADFNCLKPFWEKEKEGLGGEILFAIVGNDVTTDYPDDIITFNYKKLNPMIYGREIYVKDRKVFYKDNNEMFFDYNFAGDVVKKPVAKASINKKIAPKVASKKAPKKVEKKPEVVSTIVKKEPDVITPAENLGIPEYLLKSGIYSTDANECFKDIPFPTGTLVKNSMNNYCEGGSFGVGRLSLSLPYTLKGVFDFYSSKNSMYGWEIISNKDYDNGKIIYKKNTREASIYIRDAGDKTDMIIIVNKK